MTFTEAARKYHHRYLLGRFLLGVLSWASGGAALGIMVYLFSSRIGFTSWLVLPAILLPSLIAGSIMLLRRNRIPDALSWLDRNISGNQELQAAGEACESDGPLTELLQNNGLHVFSRLGPRPPRPEASPLSFLLALVSMSLCFLFVVAGASFLNPRDEDLALRGAELETWAKVWAEESEESGESRELADRMGRLGQRMASGELGAAQVERALKEMEEEIEQRQDDLVRDRIADTLVEDLDLDRKSAEAFRVGKKRLPAEVLSELGEAITQNTILSSAEREQLERLLSDPDLRENNGRGRPELTEKLNRAFDNALDTEDPIRRKLDEAMRESQKARMSEIDPDAPDSGDPIPDPSAIPMPAQPGDSAGDGDDGNTGGDSPSSSGISGGSGRGNSAITDDGSGSLPPIAAESEDNPMHLPSGNDGSSSWKTVIRAYGEAGDTIVTPDADGLPPWSMEVESVIGSDDIPPGVRDYVREYFLALEAGVDVNDRSLDETSTETGAIPLTPGSATEE